MDASLAHRTLTFERHSPAAPARVFAALADPAQRAVWASPSDTATFFYEAADFREGGEDRFRCGSREAPQFTGRTRHALIRPEVAVVSTEVVEAGGQPLMASLITTRLEPQRGGTRITMTVQITSFHGEEMIAGTETGTNAALDNLVAFTTR